MVSSSDSDNVSATRFLWSFSVAVILLCATLATINLVIDPYLVAAAPRRAGINAHKPTAIENSGLIKAYDVFRVKPRSLVLGSSRVGSGIDSSSPWWPEPDRPVYNLGTPLGDPATAYRYLQNVTARERISLVVVGIEFQESETPTNPLLEEIETHLTVDRNGKPLEDERRIQWRDLLVATLSFDASADSVTTLFGNLRGNLSDVNGGFWNATEYQEWQARAGAGVFFAENDLAFSLWYTFKQHNPRPMKDLRAIVEWCRARGIRLIFFINPTHADELEVIDLAGAWTEFEQWKRELVALTASSQGGSSGAPVELWDFCDYNSYTTEPVLPGRHRMQWFMDTEHYNQMLGDRILTRIFGGGAGNFGMLLTPSNLESHLANIREQQRQYRNARPEQLQRVRSIYQASVRLRNGFASYPP